MTGPFLGISSFTYWQLCGNVGRPRCVPKAKDFPQVRQHTLSCYEFCVHGFLVLYKPIRWLLSLCIPGKHARAFWHYLNSCNFGARSWRPLSSGQKAQQHCLIMSYPIWMDWTLHCTLSQLGRSRSPGQLCWNLKGVPDAFEGNKGQQNFCEFVEYSKRFHELLSFSVWIKHIASKTRLFKQSWMLLGRAWQSKTANRNAVMGLCIMESMYVFF